MTYGLQKWSLCPHTSPDCAVQLFCLTELGFKCWFQRNYCNIQFCVQYKNTSEKTLIKTDSKAAGLRSELFCGQ